MVLLTQAEAQQAIDNVLNALEVGSREFGKIPKKATAKRAGRKYTGAARDLVDIINKAIDEYGTIFVGSIIERAKRFVDTKDPSLYYESTNEEIIDKQEFTIENFDNAINNLINELIADFEAEAPEEPEPKPEQKPTREEIKADYRKARRQLQQLIRRRKKKGIDVSVFGIKIPSIPKKITAGSIRRLAKEIAKVKQIR